ncbi:deoxyribodipyrimidine photo-lyase [Flavobacteriaceae bacterium 3-367]
MKDKLVIFWFRRDLRLQDNAGLLHALQSGYPVLPVFIFDTAILDQLPKNDPRVSFIHGSLQEMDQRLRNDFGSGLAQFHGKPLEVYKMLMDSYDVHTVYTNHDYEPYALERDRDVCNFLSQRGIGFEAFKDQVIFEKGEILKDDGTPYVVYTPYMKRWKAVFNQERNLRCYDTVPYLQNVLKMEHSPSCTLQEMGFEPSNITVPDAMLDSDLLANYGNTRDFPGLENGTSRLGPHLRFGTVSIRELVKQSLGKEVFWNELIWREFFMQILWHYPHTVTKAFKPKYDRIPWRMDLKDFEKWKTGQTGYPLVDAGMRQLNTTGYMHNRVRMLVASFLCKHLLIDWRWGEAYFAEKLLDYELSSNVGNWQWAAGSGVDAAPYFRIFNPMTQLQKFDKDRSYIQQWIPDLQEFSYPSPMVDHKTARERCLQVYRKALA